MKKILVMSALVAFSAAFVACSSNDDLVQQKPDVPEETIEGTPLTIKVTDATRGTDWTATSLPSFTLYSTEHGGTTRWLGTYENGSSSGVVFGNGTTSTPNVYTGDFTSADPILWPAATTPAKTYDFYAISDATFAKEDDGQAGEQDAEHFDATPRTFTYTVNNDYDAQTDLLVASALNQSETTASGVVTLPFQHALAQIGSVNLKFKPVGEDNSQWLFIIKSMKLKNVASTAKFTFPDGDLTESNITDAWSNPTNLVDYTFTFPDFERDVNGNIAIFVEDQDADGDYTQNEGTAYAVTRRGRTNPADPTDGFDLPNYICFYNTTAEIPDGSGNHPYNYPSTYNFPLAKNGVADDGLYLLPQTLAKTKMYIHNDGGTDFYEINHDQDSYNADPDAPAYTTPYLEVSFLTLNDPSYDPTDPETLVSFTDVTEYFGGANTGTGNWPNARITAAIDNDDLHTVSIPLTSVTLDANNRYTLNFYFNMAINTDDDNSMLFSGAGIQ